MIYIVFYEINLFKLLKALKQTSRRKERGELNDYTGSRSRRNQRESPRESPRGESQSKKDRAKKAVYENLNFSQSNESADISYDGNLTRFDASGRVRFFTFDKMQL